MLEHHPQITQLRLSELMCESSVADKVELHQQGVQQGDYEAFILSECHAFHIELRSNTSVGERLQLEFLRA